MLATHAWSADADKAASAPAVRRGAASQRSGGRSQDAETRARARCRQFAATIGAGCRRQLPAARAGDARGRTLRRGQAPSLDRARAGCAGIRTALGAGGGRSRGPGEEPALARGARRRSRRSTRRWRSERPVPRPSSPLRWPSAPNCINVAGDIPRPGRRRTRHPLSTWHRRPATPWKCSPWRRINRGSTGKFEDAAAQARRAVGGAETAFRPGRPRLAAPLRCLANSLVQLGTLAEARVDTTARTRNRRSRARAGPSAGRRTVARPRALADQPGRLWRGAPGLAPGPGDLPASARPGALVRDLDDAQSGEHQPGPRRFSRSGRLLPTGAKHTGTRRFGAEHPNISWALIGRAESAVGLGRHAEAVRLLDRALRIRRKTMGGEHARVARTLTASGTKSGQSGRDQSSDRRVRRGHRDVGHVEAARRSVRGVARAGGDRYRRAGTTCGPAPLSTAPCRSASSSSASATIASEKRWRGCRARWLRWGRPMTRRRWRCGPKPSSANIFGSRCLRCLNDRR